MDTVKLRRVFSSLPVLETERLVLRRIAQENAYDMFAYASLSDVTRYLLWSPHINIDETRGYIEFLQQRYRRGEYGDWGLNCKADGRFIGTVGFADLMFAHNKGELGYVLNPEYQGKGYMREALGAVMELAFMEGNVASERLAEACGFRYEGTSRESLLVKEVYRTIRHYGLLKSDYLSARQ